MLVERLLPFLAMGFRVANALAEWLLTYAIHSTLLIGGLLVLSALPAGRKLAGAHGSWLWRFALLGAVVTSSVQSWRSAAPLGGTMRVDGDSPPSTRLRVELKHEELAISPTVEVPRWSTPAGNQTIRATMIDIRPGWPIWALGCWFAIAAALLAWYAWARARFLHGIGPRRDGTHTLAGLSLRHLQRVHGLPGVRLTLSDSLTSPVALDGREICLPARALSDLDPIRLESILAHELAHIARRDPAWLAVARIVEGVFFFQPLNRIARRRMQESAEFASDAWASSRLARPLDLAHCLARVAEWTVATRHVPVPAMAERRDAVLVRRVERLTSGRIVAESVPGGGLRLAGAVAMVVMVVAAPRGAIGAEVGDRVAAFQPAVAGPAGGLVIVRHAGEGVGAGPVRAETLMVRVQRDSAN